MTGELERCEMVTGQVPIPGAPVAPYYTDDVTTLLHGDAATVLLSLPDESVNCVVTSPPYWGLRDYAVDGQLGQESAPDEYVAALRAVFAEVARVMAPTGTCWLNLGDTYSGRANAGPSRARHRGHGHQNGYPSVQNRTAWAPYKSAFGMPWRVAFALQDDGWRIRNAIVWHKPNGLPESVTDRLNTRYELLFLLTRSDRYFFDLDAIREPHARQWGGKPNGGGYYAGLEPGEKDSNLPAAQPHPLGRNPGDVWSIPTTPSRHDHYAAFPVEIPRRCIAAGCPAGGTVLDPFSGTGTTGEAARRLGRRYVGVDLNEAYLDIQVQRFAQSVIA
jgi:DNA modification methylase